MTMILQQANACSMPLHWGGGVAGPVIYKWMLLQCGENTAE